MAACNTRQCLLGTSVQSNCTSALILYNLCPTLTSPQLNVGLPPPESAALADALQELRNALSRNFAMELPATLTFE